MFELTIAGAIILQAIVVCSALFIYDIMKRGLRPAWEPCKWGLRITGIHFSIGFPITVLSIISAVVQEVYKLWTFPAHPLISWGMSLPVNSILWGSAAYVTAWLKYRGYRFWLQPLCGFAIVIMMLYGPARAVYNRIALLPVHEAIVRREGSFDSIRLLGSLGQAAKDAAPLLLETVRDRNVHIWSRLEAVSALESVLGYIPKEAVGPLIEIVEAKGPYPGSALSAAVARLGDIGPEAKEAIPTLLEAQQNPDPVVRNVASTALKKVGYVPSGTNEKL